jgi:hypothetical protein
LLVSVAIVIGLYVMTRERALPKAESEEVVNTFRFSRMPLPEVANPHEENFELKAGWHTIRLGWPADGKR